MSAELHVEGEALRFALWYAELGWRVLPVHAIVDGVCTCGDAECNRPAKHPVQADWPALATSDPEVIRETWKRWPWAGVGIATGQASGVVVLDVDGEAGERSLAELVAKLGPVPLGPIVRTARGRHLYFRAPLGARLANRVGFRPGLDLRADNGFVVAPPSVHEAGLVYACEADASPAERDLAAPEWLLAALGDSALHGDAGRRAATHSNALSGSAPHSAPNQGQYQPSPPSRSHVGESRSAKWAQSGLDHECARVRVSSPGGRNDTLNRASFNIGTLVGGGRLDFEAARGALVEAAIVCGLSKSEATKTIASGLRGGMEAETRSAPTGDRPDWVPTNGATNGHARAVAAVGGDGWEPKDDLTDASQPSAPRLRAGAPDAEPTHAGPKLEPAYDTTQLFAELPPQRWLVPALQLGPGRPMLIAGYGSSAKTLAVQQLALALASGRKIWDHFEPLGRGRILHVDYEQGFYATAKRYQRLAIGHGIDPGELGDRIRYIQMPRVYLDKREHEQIFVHACEGFDLVIFDALRGAAPHSDENDSAFRGALDLCTYASQCTNVAGLLLHHAAKPKEGHKADARTLARGSSAIYDASGCVLNIVARAGSPARLVTQVKTPAEAEGGAIDPFELVVEDVPADNDPRAGVRVVWRVPEVIDVTDAAETVFERDAALVIKSIRRRVGQSSNVIVSKCGVPRARALDVLKALADEGRVEVSTGKNRSKFYRVPDRPGEPLTDESEHD